MRSSRSFGVAVALAASLAACGRSPEGEASPRVLPAFDTSPGALASVDTGYFGALYSNVRSVAFQPDGKFVVAGQDNNAGGRFLVARYNADASPDASFGGGGRVTADFAGSNEAVNAVRLQPDGKIVAVGFATNPDGTTRVALIRLNPNGSFDSSFDGDGRKTSTVAGVASITANAVAVQTVGGALKIVLAGEAGPRFLTMRYNANGGLDGGFDGDGVALTTVGGSNGRAIARALVAQPDGKVVVGGVASNDTTGRCFGGPCRSFALVRYNTNGSLDSSFSAPPVPTGNTNANQINALILQPDGRIVAAGFLQVGSTSGAAVARYATSGALEDHHVFSGYGWANDVVRQPDGRIVAAGYDGESGPLTFAVYRLTAALDPDTTFGGGDGVTLTPSGGRSDIVYRVGITNSRIVAAGTSFSTAGFDAGTEFAIARYFR